MRRRPAARWPVPKVVLRGAAASQWPAGKVRLLPVRALVLRGRWAQRAPPVWRLPRGAVGWRPGPAVLWWGCSFVRASPLVLRLPLAPGAPVQTPRRWQAGWRWWWPAQVQDLTRGQAQQRWAQRLAPTGKLFLLRAPSLLSRRLLGVPLGVPTACLGRDAVASALGSLRCSRCTTAPKRSASVRACPPTALAPQPASTSGPDPRRQSMPERPARSGRCAWGLRR